MEPMTEKTTNAIVIRRPWDAVPQLLGSETCGETVEVEGMFDIGMDPGFSFVFIFPQADYMWLLQDRDQILGPWLGDIDDNPIHYTLGVSVLHTYKHNTVYHIVLITVLKKFVRS
jgi:hypothetical protein